MGGVARLVVTAAGAIRLRGGHPWIYRPEVVRLEGTWRVEEAVSVTDGAGRVLGRGFYNPRPRIAVRLLTHHDEPVDAAFLRRRLERAWRYRESLAYDGDAGRVSPARRRPSRRSGCTCASPTPCGRSAWTSRRVGSGRRWPSKS